MTLQGSERQVAWATDIRKTFTDYMDHHIESSFRTVERRKAKGKEVKEEFIQHQTATAKQFKDFKNLVVETQTDAKWWIDNKHCVKEVSWMAHTMGINWYDALENATGKKRR